jgi:hypothetical protein
MAFSIHPVRIERAEGAFELAFMSEDDAFEFASSRKLNTDESVSVPPSYVLYETLEEAKISLDRMIASAGNTDNHKYIPWSE